MLLRRLKNDKGFTLAETLIAVLILLMVSAVVALGIPAASNAYAKAVDGANAQVLLSTSITALRNQLEFAKDISVKDYTPVGSTEVLQKIEYISSDNGGRSIISNSDDKSGIMLYEYADPDDQNGYLLSRLLVSGKAATKSLYFKYGEVDDSTPGVLTFRNLQVIRKGAEETPLVTVPLLKIKIYSP